MNQIWVVIFLLFQMCCCQLRQDFIPEGGKDLPLCKELIVNSDHIVTDSYFFSHCLHPRFSSYYSHWNPSHTTENVDDEAKTSPRLFMIRIVLCWILLQQSICQLQIHAIGAIRRTAAFRCVTWIQRIPCHPAQIQQFPVTSCYSHLPKVIWKRP